MKKRRITEKRFETKLAKLIERALDKTGGRVTAFEEAGVLTMNRGLVVSLANDQEFQVTIVESSRR